MLRMLFNALKLAVGTLMALPLLLMFLGFMLALGGGIAGAAEVRDFGKALAGLGALGFVVVLIFGGDLFSALSNSTAAAGQTNSKDISTSPANENGVTTSSAQVNDTVGKE